MYILFPLCHQSCVPTRDNQPLRQIRKLFSGRKKRKISCGRHISDTSLESNYYPLTPPISGYLFHHLEPYILASSQDAKGLGAVLRTARYKSFLNT
jgi:hypothetical protein